MVKEFPCVITPCKLDVQKVVPVWVHEMNGSEVILTRTILCPGKSGGEVLELLIKALGRCSSSIDWHAGFNEHVYELSYQDDKALKNFWYEVARGFGTAILAGQLIIQPPSTEASVHDRS